MAALLCMLARSGCGHSTSCSRKGTNCVPNPNHQIPPACPVPRNFHQPHWWPLLLVYEGGSEYMWHSPAGPRHHPPTHAALPPASLQCSQLATSSTLCNEAPSNERFQPTATLTPQPWVLHTGQVMPWSEITPGGYKTGVMKRIPFYFAENCLKISEQGSPGQLLLSGEGKQFGSSSMACRGEGQGETFPTKSSGRW